MNFLELTRARYSVRNYTDRLVEPEKLDYIFECVRMAPSAVNYQPWRFAVVTDPERLAAAEQGLGTCWVCNFDVPRCREVMQLPENLEPVALIPLGYPADPSVAEKKRKVPAELFL